MEYKANNPFDDSSSSRKADPALQKRAEELRKKEEELNKREQNLHQRDQILNEREKMVDTGVKNNWPICKPFLYHNIDGDMATPELKRLVRFAYAGWMYAVVCLAFNIAALAACMGVNGDSKSIGDFILSIVYFIILGPCWFMIYRVLYKAGRKRKPSLFIFYWCLYTLQLIACCAFAVGVAGTGAGGFFRMVNQFKTNKTVGFILLASAILWCICAAYAIWIFILSRLEYKKSGGYAQARKEMGNAALNEAAKHPDLIAKGVKAGAKEASKHPELITRTMSS